MTPTLCRVLATCCILNASAAAFGQAPQAPGPERAWHHVEPDRAMELLGNLPTQRAGYRTPEDVEGLQRTEELVIEILEGLGYEPKTEDVPRPERIAMLTPPEAPTPRNIWVDLPGTGERASEMLIMMAHIDSVVGSPGADDNGTGVVALFEMARLLQDRPRERTVRLLFTNLEEVGLHGARRHASSLEPRVDAGQVSIVGAVSVEMIGYYSDEPGSQSSPLPPGITNEALDRGDFLALVGVRRHQRFTQDLTRAMLESEPDARVVTLDMFVVPPPDIMRSDHAEFLIRGWPGAMLTDTANFRNPHYHQATDTPETIDRVRFARAISQLVGAVDRLANPNTWNEGEQSPGTNENENDAATR
jgi:hypothetical protein